MSTILYLTTALMSLYMASSYILLTANLEDFQTIAKQIAASPVGNQINQIIRRASNLFNQQLNAEQPSEPHKRSDSKIDEGNSFEVWKPDALERVKESASDSDSLSEKDEEYLKDRDVNLVERRSNSAQHADTLGPLGKNASYYLQSIKKIFDNV